MIDLRDGQITGLLNNSMRYNPETIAMGYALHAEKQRILILADRTRLMASIHTLDEKILDHLAIELRTPAYDDRLPIEIKQNLISGTLSFYANLGTPAAVRWLIQSIFGAGQLLEWFEYGGEPHHFKIILDEHPDPALKRQFLTALNTVKRKSQWLEKLVYQFVSLVQNPLNEFRHILRIRTHIFNLRGIPPVCFDGRVNFGGEILFDQQLASTVYRAPLLFDGAETFGGSISFDRQVAGSFRTIALWIRAGVRTANRPGLPGTVCRIGTGFLEHSRASPAVRVRAVQRERLSPRTLLAGSRAANVGGGRLYPAVRARAETPERPRTAPFLRSRAESAGRFRPRGILLQTCIHTSNTVKATLRVNTLYEFGGAYGFDGERRFNADIIDL